MPVQETEKRCSRCKQTKPLIEFGKCASERLGVQPACRFCMAEYGKKRHANMTPEQREVRRRYARKDYATHRDHRLEWQRRYREESRSAVIASGKKSKAKRAEEIRQKKRSSRLLEPQKHRAQDVSKKAIANGILVPGECEIATGCLGAVQGHHDDYSKPLEVRWFCRRHHQQWHRKNGPGMNAT